MRTARQECIQSPAASEKSDRGTDERNDQEGVIPAWLYAIIVCGLTLTPIIFCFGQLNAYALDVPFNDDWSFFKFVGQLDSGAKNLWSLFYEQHNDGKVAAYYALLLCIAKLTNFSTTAVIYLNFTIQILNMIVLMALAYPTFKSTKYPLLWLTPIAWITFCPRNALLIGECLVTFEARLFLLVALLGIQRTRKIDGWLILAMVSAFLTTYTCIMGLATWALGFLYILWRDRTEPDSRLKAPLLFWTITSFVVTALYFDAYTFGSGSSRHLQLVNLVNCSLDCVKFILLTFANPFVSHNDGNQGVLIGLVYLLACGTNILVLSRSKPLNNTLIPMYLLALFTVVLNLLIFYARVGSPFHEYPGAVDLGAPLAVRYSVGNQLGVAATCVLCLAAFRAFYGRRLIYLLPCTTFFGLLAFCMANCFQQAHAYGQNMYNRARIAEMILRTSDKHHLEAFRYLVAQKPLRASQLVGFVKEKRISVFSQSPPQYVARKPAAPGVADCHWAIDQINGKIAVPGKILAIKSNDPELFIAGWACDGKTQKPFPSARIVIDRFIEMPTACSMYLTSANKTPAQIDRTAKIGLHARFKRSQLRPGRHDVIVRIFTDSTHYLDSETLATFEIH